MKSMVGEGAGLATGFCLSPRLESRHVKDKRGSNLGANDGLARRSSFLFSPQPKGLVPLIGAAPDLWPPAASGSHSFGSAGKAAAS